MVSLESGSWLETYRWSFRPDHRQLVTKAFSGWPHGRKLLSSHQARGTVKALWVSEGGCSKGSAPAGHALRQGCLLAREPSLEGLLSETLQQRLSIGTSSKTPLRRERKRELETSFFTLTQHSVLSHSQAIPHRGPWGSMESQVTEKETIGSWIGRNHIRGGQVSMTLDTIDWVSISRRAHNNWIPERGINVLWENSR